MYEQTCRKHHQTPYSILKCLPGICQANSFSQMPALQSFTREFWLSTNQSAPRGERFTVLPGKVYFSSIYPRPPPTLRYNAPPTHAGPVHSVIPGSGHNHTYRRTSSATAKRLYVLGAARTRHLPALEFPAQCSLWPVYSRRLRSPESAPSARL